MTTARSLHELQGLDWEIDQRRAQLASVDARLHDDSALVKVKKELQEHEEALGQLAKQQTGQTQEVQQREEKVRVLEERLYGGSIRNPKELESLQGELEYAKQHASVAQPT